MSDDACTITYGLPWSIVVPLFLLYLVWSHTLGTMTFLLTSTSFSRRWTIRAGLRAYELWQYLRSLALVSVAYRTSGRSLFQQPTIRFILGHGGGGRRCGSLVVYSPPDNNHPSPQAAVVFDD